MAQQQAEEIYHEKRGVQAKTLGHLRLRDSETNEVILVPTPSSDSKDPLNWYQTLLLSI